MPGKCGLSRLWNFETLREGSGVGADDCSREGCASQIERGIHPTSAYPQ
jgi:hypothetical protein